MGEDMWLLGCVTLLVHIGSSVAMSTYAISSCDAVAHVSGLCRHRCGATVGGNTVPTHALTPIIPHYHLHL